MLYFRHFQCKQASYFEALPTVITNIQQRKHPDNVVTKTISDNHISWIQIYTILSPRDLSFGKRLNLHREFYRLYIHYESNGWIDGTEKIEVFNPKSQIQFCLQGLEYLFYFCSQYYIGILISKSLSFYTCSLWRMVFLWDSRSASWSRREYFILYSWNKFRTEKYRCICYNWAVTLPLRETSVLPRPLNINHN